MERLTARLPSPWSTVVDWLVTIVIAVAAVLAIKAWIVNPYRIPSSSMEPTLHCAQSLPGDGCEARFSDRVLANRFIYHFREPRRGEIVVFETPPTARQPEPAGCGAGGTFVKRLVGLPGDRWEQRRGVIYINGRRLREPYVRPARRGNESYPPRRIGADEYFMMGDNRARSCDSRKWGTVPRENLVGPVFAVYWPPNRIGVR